MLERDPDLLERLEGCVQQAFAGTVHRVVWADRGPLQGSSVARGRWNSPESGFEVLNTSLEAEGAAARSSRRSGRCSSSGRTGRR